MSRWPIVQATSGSGDRIEGNPSSREGSASLAHSLGRTTRRMKRAQRRAAVEDEGGRREPRKRGLGTFGA